MTPSPSSPASLRPRSVWAVYGASALLGYWQNGLGTILAPLREDLHVDLTQVAFYPTLFAGALLVTGLLGDRLVRGIGRRMALLGAVVGVVAGALLLCVVSRPVTMVGALLLGFGCALTLQVLPLVVDSAAPGHGARLNSEANGVASAMAILVPWLVGGAIGAGLGWRTGWLALPLVVAVAVVALVLVTRDSVPGFARSMPEPPPGVLSDDDRQDAGAQPPSISSRRPMTWRWILLTLAISAEFCVLLWATDAFRQWHHLSDTVATAVLSAFLVGMAIGRFLFAGSTSRLPVRVVVWRQAGIALVGFLLFWASPWWPVAALGLLVIGTGLSVLYPTGVSHCVAAWPDRPERAAGLTLVGSATAIALAPQLLARLATASDMRHAYLVVPAVLLVLAVVAPLADPRRA